MSNPDMTRQLMDDPFVQNLVSNPEYIRSIITANPQIQQLMERNPEVNHILNNPEVLRQTMEMMRNPAAFQELMRTQDRALSNLESLPGGYNALRRMYTELQEPMMNAAQEQLVGDNPFASFLNQNAQRPPAPNPEDNPAGQQSRTENRDPLPNPWSRSGGSTAGRPASTGTGSAGPGAAPGAGTPPVNMFNNPGMQSLMNQMMGNTAFMSSMMNSPYMQQMMDSFGSSPEMMQQILDNNPMMASNPALQQQMRDALPAMMQRMQSPEVRESLTNPQALDALAQIRRGMLDLQRIAPNLMTTFG
jgi:ubiquilin